MNPIIVTTDGSDHSLRVFPHADRLARALGAELQAVRVVEPSEIAPEPGEDRRAAIEHTCARLTEEVAGTLRRAGIDGTASCMVGEDGKSVGDTLLAHAAGASVIAMHSRGRSGIGRLLHGIKEILEDTGSPQAVEAARHGSPGAIALRHITPGGARTENP